MKNRQYVLPCGRVVFQKISNAKDMGWHEGIRNTLLANKKELSKLYNPNSCGRKRKEWCEYTYNKFVSILMRKLMDNLMEGNRVETAPFRFWVIGNIGETKYVSWETDGRNYAVKVEGLKTEYRIMLSVKRRRELRKRILNGQAFH